MKTTNRYLYVLSALSLMCLIVQCSKNEMPDPVTPPVTPAALLLNKISIDHIPAASSGTIYNVAPTAALRLTFNNAVDRATVAGAVSLNENGTSHIAKNIAYENHDSTIVITGSAPLKYITKYFLEATVSLKSVANGSLYPALNRQFVTKIDSTDKLPQITDNELLDKVQLHTFRYFWDFAHPACGLARERTTSGDLVTTGGSGFGIMAITIAINRAFITRSEGLTRMQTIVAFLKNTAQTFHGAYPHWLNGNTGVVIPFGQFDDGADLVETSYLMQGLICAREYFNGTDPAETTLRDDINTIYQRVDWDWFRQGGQNVLFWHWSPTQNWIMNFRIQGWNESLITYVMAASSPTHPIPRTVYDQGWARNGNMVTNSTYYGYSLPLGEPYGGPLFYAHYSFLGIDPNQLSDAYANYFTQNQHHALINYNYCTANPQHHFGYSDLCWGLTACDIPAGYTANSPTNDNGVIAPTAALASFPYTPTESMKALKFFYYKLGDKIWDTYGFYDAFSLKDAWFANSMLAIDQGPIIVMIENYRTGMPWHLFTGAPEVKDGMRNLGFTAPYL